MQTELCHFSVCVLFELVCIPVKLIITLIQSVKIILLRWHLV